MRFCKTSLGNLACLSRAIVLTTLCVLVLNCGLTAQVLSKTTIARDTPSKYCQDKFPQARLGRTKTTQVAHQYVLLIAFDVQDERYDDSKVNDFFHTSSDTSDKDKPAGTQPPTGCTNDPDPSKAVLAQGSETTSGITVMGGCPRDCLALAAGSVSSPAARRNAASSRNDGRGNRADPLQDYPGMDWGIFYADPSGEGAQPARDSNARLRVWQIFAKSALHASKIVKSLRDQGLSAANLPGYKGELLIGYSVSPASPK